MGLSAQLESPFETARKVLQAQDAKRAAIAGAIHDAASQALEAALVAARIAALEEAAQECDARRYGRCAAAIRALKAIRPLNSPTETKPE